MAVWTEKRKCMLVGHSGLQYSAVISCAKPLDVVIPIVREFYQKRGAMPQDGSSVQSLTFSRGREWISKLSWMLALSEKWPRQIIMVSIRRENEMTLVDISYNVRIFFTMIVAPNALVKEIRELRFMLETK